jgi:hypothetical protein
MVGARRGPGTEGAGGSGWGLFEEAYSCDWEFVRPTGKRTDPAAVILCPACPTCGAPYHSDFDDSCLHCRTVRPDGLAGWRLDRLSYVVGPDRGEGPSRQQAAEV